MNRSWTIGRPFGIEVRVHVTLVILVAVVALSHMASHGIQAGLGILFLATVVFASVALHELGHALTARIFGIGTRRVTLLPIGGVASIDRMPQTPLQEIVIAAAGPAVSLCLAVPLLVAGLLLSFETLFTAGAINAVLGIFNLLPAFPMDGGRVFRAVLARYMGHLRATHIAARTGQGCAVLLGLVGLLGYGPMLIFIAIFVAWTAEAELRAARRMAWARGAAPAPFANVFFGGPRGVPFSRPGGRPAPFTGGGWRVVDPGEPPRRPPPVPAYLEETAPGVYTLRRR